MVNSSNTSPLFDVQDAFKGAYAPRIQAFTEAGQQAGSLLLRKTAKKSR